MLTFLACAGAGLTLQHLRATNTCPDGYEELKPIDENLMYDFNYQQVVHFSQEVKVIPVSRVDSRHASGQRGETLWEECTVGLDIFVAVCLLHTV